MSIKYDISDIEKCEYIEAMKKVYFKPPKQINGKCVGFINKYNGNVSNICKNCKNLVEVVKHDD